MSNTIKSKNQNKTKRYIKNKKRKSRKAGSLDYNKMQKDLNYREGFEFGKKHGYENGVRETEMRLQSIIDKYYNFTVEVTDNYNRLYEDYEHMEKAQDELVKEGRQIIQNLKDKKNKCKEDLKQCKHKLKQLKH